MEINSNNKFIRLEDLEVYKLARELSKISWKIFEQLDWHDKKIMGDQFIESTDSIAANIAEGYFRYHYLDRVKFYYNARGSLAEAEHWLELFKERGKVSVEQFNVYRSIVGKLSIKLNNFIASSSKAKYNKSQ